MRRLNAYLMSAWGLGLWACTPQETETQAPAVELPKVDDTQISTASALCIAPPSEGRSKTLEMGGQRWEQSGTTLKALGRQKPLLKLGLLADVKEATPENMQNLRNLLAWFEQVKVDMIAILGDSGEAEADIVSTVGLVAASDRPTLVMMGNRESTTRYQSAMATLASTYPNVVDLNEVRRIDLVAVDLLSLPGYFNPDFIHAKDGCRYGATELAQLESLIDASDSPVVVLSHGGPLQSGSEALDLTSEQQHVGDPDLAALLAKKNVRFGAFANIHEAGGRGTDLLGTARLPPKVRHKNLFVNPGPADAVMWAMNDGSKSVGMAAVLKVSKAGASYQLRRLKP